MDSSRPSGSDRQFEPSCPYYRAGNNPPMFRFVERFAQNSQFVGDSLGGRAYIDRSQPRPCSPSCFCRDLDSQLSSEYVFVVSKTKTSIEIEIKSRDLSLFLCNFLGHHLPPSEYLRLNGFELLSNTEILKIELQHLMETVRTDTQQRWPLSHSERDERVQVELSLLLDGLITDYQVFESFGYESLYEQGFLTYDSWKSFQSARTLNIIGQLEKDFLNVVSEDNSGPFYGPSFLSIDSVAHFNNTKSMINAIHNGDTTSLASIIERGVDPSLGLNAVLTSQSAPALELLLKYGADWDCVVPVRARAALVAAVQAGNLPFIDLFLKIRGQSGAQIGPEFELDGWTPLMLAATYNYRRIALSLLRHGANPLSETCNGNALNIARQHGFNDMTQILLKNVRVSLPSNPKSHRSQHDIDSQEGSGLSEGRNPLKSTLERDRMDSKQKWRHIQLWLLHLEFYEQHSKICECAKLSLVGPLAENTEEIHILSQIFELLEACSSLFQLPNIVSISRIRKSIASMTLSGFGAFGIDENFSQAWKSGIAAMRELCVGKAPSSMNGVLMFVAIAKAIYSSGYSHDLSIRESGFFSDLGRWQMLFKPDTYKLAAFQEAIKSIWGFDLEQLEHVDSPDSESLAVFQELAMSLADEAEMLFSIEEHKDSLLAVQQRWRPSGEAAPEDDRYQKAQSDSRPRLAEVQALRDRDSLSTESLLIDTARKTKRLSVQDKLRFDSRAYKFDLTVTLIMAGLIFGIALGFLLEFRAHLSTPNFDIYSHGYWSESLSKTGLEDAVTHISLVVSHELASNYKPAIEITGESLLNQVRSGLILNYAGLVDFLRRKHFVEPDMTSETEEHLHHHFLTTCLLWQSSYSLQEHYQLFQAYLGLREYRRIVDPTRIHPLRAETTPQVVQSAEVAQVDSPSGKGIIPTESNSSPSNPSLAASTSTIEIDMQTPRSLGLHSDPSSEEGATSVNSSSRVLTCGVCQRTFKGTKAVGNLNKHRKDKHQANKQTYPCRHSLCRARLSRKAYRDKHEREKHGLNMVQ